MKTERLFDPLTDRYAFDFKLCTVKRGFAQVDTRQDASYYGTWASPRERKIVSYTEGDITIETAATDAEFTEAIRELKRWHEENDCWKGIDPGFDPALKLEFEQIGLGDLLH